ncbi:hypothetical protein RRG08_047724 [Elysia crispata]|uniref:Uncharacterized protein n=1 Tax=Elysia crispata TaxID=231223 RepID=A0AAE1DUD1_9GAST|nr:hypothetical protein RRG08_047724 [Elysia crispata]
MVSVDSTRQPTCLSSNCLEYGVALGRERVKTSNSFVKQMGQAPSSQPGQLATPLLSSSSSAGQSQAGLSLHTCLDHNEHAVLSGKPRSSGYLRRVPGTMPPVISRDIHAWCDSEQKPVDSSTDPLGMLTGYTPTCTGIASTTHPFLGLFRLQSFPPRLSFPLFPYEISLTPLKTSQTFDLICLICTRESPRLPEESPPTPGRLTRGSNEAVIAKSPHAKLRPDRSLMIPASRLSPTISK